MKIKEGLEKYFKRSVLKKKNTILNINDYVAET